MPTISSENSDVLEIRVSDVTRKISVFSGFYLRKLLVN